MIIDFSMPVFNGKEWCVRVIKTVKNGNLYPQNTRFEDKDDAYNFYENVRKVWQKQRQRGE